MRIGNHAVRNRADKKADTGGQARGRTGARAVQFMAGARVKRKEMCEEPGSKINVHLVYDTRHLGICMQ